ncbi:MAG: metalloenzyme [Ignavibacteriales bacterium]|nr:MAG: metalloenzyme [Ignavibacteriales bacterium]
MVFIDGVGIGADDPERNPFVKYGFKTFLENFGTVPTLKNPELTSNDIQLFPVDALMGVDGLPQSGTGQTSIFCGFNASQFIGKHFGPYPYSTLVPLIKEKNIFIELKRLKKKVFFANAYPKVFFDYIDSGKKRLSVTSLSCILSNMKLNKSAEVRSGKALTAEITNERWNKKLGYKLKIISPVVAAKRLVRISLKNHFTLFEYFLTDHLGHGRLEENFDSTFNEIDIFLKTLIEESKKNNFTLVICSDHGNLEDISVKTHTLNPALAITAGRYSEVLKKQIKHLYDIKPAIISILK